MTRGPSLKVRVRPLRICRRCDVCVVACALISLLGGLTTAIMYLFSGDSLFGQMIYVFAFSLCLCGVLISLFAPKLYHIYSGSQLDENMQIQTKQTGSALIEAKSFYGEERKRGLYRDGDRLLWADSDMEGRSKDEQFAIAQEQIEMWMLKRSRMEEQFQNSSASGKSRNHVSVSPAEV